MYVKYIQQPDNKDFIFLKNSRLLLSIFTLDKHFFFFPQQSHLFWPDISHPPFCSNSLLRLVERKITGNLNFECPQMTVEKVKIYEITFSYWMRFSMRERLHDLIKLFFLFSFSFSILFICSNTVASINNSKGKY